MSPRVIWIIPLLPISILLTQIDCGQTPSESPGSQDASALPNHCAADLWNTDMAVDMACTITYEMIQEDIIINLGCAQNGCHHATAANKFRIDRTAGKLLDNYNSLFTSQLVVKGDPDQSTLITVPATGKTTTGVHLKTLAGSRLYKWRSWVTMGAPF